MSLKYYAKVNRSTGRLFGPVMRRKVKPAGHYQQIESEPDCSGCQGEVKKGTFVIGKNIPDDQTSNYVAFTTNDSIRTYSQRTLTIDWGDGQTESGLIDGSYEHNYEYGIFGNYNVTVSLENTPGDNLRDITIDDASDIRGLEGYIDLEEVIIRASVLSYFPKFSNVIKIFIYNTLLAELKGLPRYLNRFIMDNNSRFTSMIVPKEILYLEINDSITDPALMDSIIIQVDANGRISGTLYLDVNAAFPTAAGLAAADNLYAKDWAVALPTTTRDAAKQFTRK